MLGTATGMTTFNAVGSVVSGLKVHPEPQALPESLIDAEPVLLAEAYNRFKEIAAVANGLAKATAEALAVRLEGGALRYGDTIYKPSTRGRAKVVDEGKWWGAVVQSLYETTDPAALLARLYPASAVRLGALPLLAAVLGVDDYAFRQTMIDYDPPTAMLDVQPIAKAPKWTHAMEDGQVSNQRVE